MTQRSRHRLRTLVCVHKCTCICERDRECGRVRQVPPDLKVVRTRAHTCTCTHAPSATPLITCPVCKQRVRLCVQLHISLWLNPKWLLFPSSVLQNSCCYIKMGGNSNCDLPQTFSERIPRLREPQSVLGNLGQLQALLIVLFILNPEPPVSDEGLAKRWEDLF